MSSSSERPAAPATPHDALFKATFSRVEHAAALLRQVLPPALVQRLDFSTLTCCPSTFVDSTLTARHTDLLFSVKLSGRPVFLYILFEHQSRVDPLMAFRLLSYMVRIWEDHLGKHPGARRLPAILPVVLHHRPHAPGRTTRHENGGAGDRDAADFEAARARRLVDDPADLRSLEVASPCGGLGTPYHRRTRAVFVGTTPCRTREPGRTHGSF